MQGRLLPKAPRRPSLLYARPGGSSLVKGMSRRASSVVVLVLALLGGAAAPFASIARLFPCMSPADCPAMADLCDMAAMTSHDSCCDPTLAGHDSALPATVSESAPQPAAHAAPGYIPVADWAPAAAGEFLAQALVVSPPGSPPAITVLRI